MGDVAGKWHGGVAIASARHDRHGVNEGSNPRVVLLFRGALGDFLLALPALRALRGRHPAAHATLVVAGWLRDLAGHAGVADACASLDDADTAGLFAGTRVPRWLADRPLVHTWLGRADPDFRARLVALASQVEVHGVERGEADEHASVTYARSLGFAASLAELAAGARLRCPPSSRAETLLARLRRPVLVVHPGAGSRAKRWSLGGFGAVVAAWRDGGGDVARLVGPAELDLPAIAGTHEVAGWELPDVAALLAAADGYLGNDSGISHLAAAVGARGVAVFGPTPAQRWRPLGDAVVAVQGHGDATGIALDALSARVVIEAVRGATRLP